MLQDLLEPAGFTVHRLRFSEAGQPDVDNLYARIGTAAPHLVFAGHTDVVPPGDAASWRFPPFSGEVADGRIWGRGACDMKGGVAAAVAAVLAHLADAGAPEGSISFLITGDEEGPAVNGTPKLLDWARDRGERFDHCVLGEPTNPARLGEMIKIGRRGSLTGEIVVEGRQGHVAYPHLADNPIPRLMRLLAALKAEPLDAGTAHFDPSNLEVVTVDTGNPSANVIPAEARARFNVRFNDSWSPEALQAEIRRRLADAEAGAHRLTFAPCNALAFLTEPGAFVTLVRRDRRSRDRPCPEAFDDRRDLGCPLHHAGLPGPGIRARRRHDACRRRERPGRRSRKASGHLRRLARPVLRRSACDGLKMSDRLSLEPYRSSLRGAVRRSNPVRDPGQGWVPPRSARGSIAITVDEASHTLSQQLI